MRFNINNKLIFLDSFQFSIFSLDSLVKKLGENDFIYLSQEFDSKVFDLAKQKGFYSYEHMSGFKKFQEELPCEERFYSLWAGKEDYW